MTLYYDIDGEPMELLDWARRFEDPEYGRIAKTQLGSGFRISTLWTGLNANIFPESKLIFETAVFDDNGLVRIYGRCATKEIAAEMHREAIIEYESYLDRVKREVRENQEK